MAHFLRSTADQESHRNHPHTTQYTIWRVRSRWSSSKKVGIDTNIPSRKDHNDRNDQPWTTLYLPSTKIEDAWKHQVGLSSAERIPRTFLSFSFSLPFFSFFANTSPSPSPSLPLDLFSTFDALQPAPPSLFTSLYTITSSHGVSDRSYLLTLVYTTYQPAGRRGLTHHHPVRPNHPLVI